VDVYLLGVCFAVIATGDYPWMLVESFAVQEGNSFLWSRIQHSSLKELVKIMVVGNPKERPSLLQVNLELVRMFEMENFID
jgi:hypothetical protein